MLFETVSSHACRDLKANSTVSIGQTGSVGFVCGGPGSENVWLHAIEISDGIVPVSSDLRHAVRHRERPRQHWTDRFHAIGRHEIGKRKY